MMNIEANFDAESQAADPFGAEMHRAGPSSFSVESNNHNG